MSKTVIAFGSCLSNITIANLVADYGFVQTHSVHHNRSDAFLDYHVRQTREMPPLDWMEAKLVYNADKEAEARQFLRNQYRSYLGFHDLSDRMVEGRSFFDDLRENQYDVILMDNFMDVAAKLAFSTLDDRYRNSPIFFNHGFYENEAELSREFHFTDFLTPRKSAQNNLAIYKWLRSFQPKAKIFYLPYHFSSSLKHKDRYLRIYNFYKEFSKLVEGEELYLVPPSNVVPNLTKGEEDWPHFEMSVYKALAGYIFLHSYANLERPGRPYRLPKSKFGGWF
jgi:hypothetical protein